MRLPFSDDSQTAAGRCLQTTGISTREEAGNGKTPPAMDDLQLAAEGARGARSAIALSTGLRPVVPGVS